jgi:hypothetical protein
MATIEAIVKPTRSPTAGVGDGYQTAISNVHGGGAGLFLQYTRWNFAYHYSLRYSSSTYPYSYRVYAAKSPPPGQWVHVAGVFDGQKLSLYVDGELQGTAVVSNPHKQSPAPFVIGAEPSGGQVTWEPANFFEGLIKAVRISGAPLYTQNFTPPADLVAERNTALLLKFNAGHGDTVRDSVNKKLTARIKDAEWVKIE